MKALADVTEDDEDDMSPEEYTVSLFLASWHSCISERDVMMCGI
jgi:hypothetical protein